MAASPFALKNLAGLVPASCQSLYNANWRKYNNCSLSKKRQIPQLRSELVRGEARLEGKLKNFGAGGF